MEDQRYILKKSGVLKPPKAKREFQAGDIVTVDDFEQCPELFRSLAVSGGLVLHETEHHGTRR